MIFGTSTEQLYSGFSIKGEWLLSVYDDDDIEHHYAALSVTWVYSAMGCDQLTVLANQKNVFDKFILAKKFFVNCHIPLVVISSMAINWWDLFGGQTFLDDVQLHELWLNIQNGDHFDNFCFSQKWGISLEMFES